MRIEKFFLKVVVVRMKRYYTIFIFHEGHEEKQILTTDVHGIARILLKAISKIPKKTVKLSPAVMVNACLPQAWRDRRALGVTLFLRTHF
ncbi:MAG: hypothetical protein HY088_02110 [Ignavibacteriales bacterium]|nr:hypothetical protein [Ignavibacteriales bacterium]